MRRQHSYRWWKAHQEKYENLVRMFGPAVREIRSSFFAMSEQDRSSLLSDYGEIYGQSAEDYARKVFIDWKLGLTKVSGQTMERLIELVPPYLSAQQRYEILQLVLAHNKPKVEGKVVRINIKEPMNGFAELETIMSAMRCDHKLAYLPENVFRAAKWLSANDVSAARALLAEVANLENNMMLSSARHEVDLLRRVISGGKVKAATYSINLPSGKVHVVAYNPSFCIIATVCFGAEAHQTKTLRQWRDDHLIKHSTGRRFVVWYYENGERLARRLEGSGVLKLLASLCISSVAMLLNLAK